MMATILGPRAVPRRRPTSISTASTARRRPARISSRAWRRRRRRSDAVPPAGTRRPARRASPPALSTRAAAPTLRLAQQVPADARPARQAADGAAAASCTLFGAETGAAADATSSWSCSTDAERTIVFDGVAERPVLSINRGFSAPVVDRDRPHRRRSRLPLGARRRSVRALRGDAAADARYAGRGACRRAAPITSR